MHGMMPPVDGLKLTPEQRQAINKARMEAVKGKHEITHRYMDKLSEADKEAMQKELQANRDKADEMRAAGNTAEADRFDQLETVLKGMDE